MGGLEERNAEGTSVALEAVPQGRHRAVGVHPLAQVREDLLPGLVALEPFQPGPFHGLGLADEGEDGVGKDGAVAVESFAGNGNVAAPEQVRFDDGLESGFGAPMNASHYNCPPPRGTRSSLVSNDAP